MRLLNTIMTNGIKDLPGIEIIGPEDPAQRGGICSILMHELPSHEVALCSTRPPESWFGGQHCVHRGLTPTVIRRVASSSAYMYNTEEDANRFVDTLTEIIDTLG